MVQVRADVASLATDALALALNTKAVSLDRTLTTAIRRQAEELGVQWANVEAADRAGQEADWPSSSTLCARQRTASFPIC